MSVTNNRQGEVTCALGFEKPRCVRCKHLTTQPRAYFEKGTGICNPSLEQGLFHFISPE